MEFLSTVRPSLTHATFSAYEKFELEAQIQEASENAQGGRDSCHGESQYLGSPQASPFALAADTRDLFDEDLQFLCHFWKGRAHRKQGEYGKASVHILLAKRTAEGAGAPKLAAVAKIHESWLAFQNGQRSYAFQLLEEAQSTLRTTGHPPRLPRSSPSSVRKHLKNLQSQPPHRRQSATSNRSHLLFRYAIPDPLVAMRYLIRS